MVYGRRHGEVDQVCRQMPVDVKVGVGEREREREREKICVNRFRGRRKEG